MHHIYLPCVVGKAASVYSPLDRTEKQLYTSHPARRLLPGLCATAADWWELEPRTPGLQLAPLHLAGHLEKCESTKLKGQIIQEIAASVKASKLFNLALNNLQQCSPSPT